MEIEGKQKGESSRDYAFRILRNNIINLGLKPGSLVSEKDLANELGLSRTPVREALIELSKVGVVEVKPQIGYRISPIDYRLVEDVQFTREVLECAVIQLACRAQKEEYLNALEENLQLQELYYKTHNRGQIMDLDNEFHKIFFQMTGKMMTYEMLSLISISFTRVRRMALDSVEEVISIREHREIFNAVLKKEESMAKQLMAKHLKQYKVDEKAILQTFPSEYFAVK